MDDFTITDVRATEGGTRLTFFVTGRDGNGTPEYLTLTVLSSRLSHIPAIGPIDPETVSFLRHENQVCSGVLYGLRALSAGDLSRGMLVRRLLQRGLSKQAACDAAGDLAARGFLDEKRAADREVEKGLCKLWGNRRILAELSVKGFGPEAMETAAERLKEENGGERCAALMKKKRLSLPAEPRGQQKLFASLARYGYSSGEIKAALTLIYGA